MNFPLCCIFSRKNALTASCWSLSTTVAANPSRNYMIIYRYVRISERTVNLQTRKLQSKEQIRATLKILNVMQCNVMTVTLVIRPNYYFYPFADQLIVVSQFYPLVMPLWIIITSYTLDQLGCTCGILLAYSNSEHPVLNSYP